MEGPYQRAPPSVAHANRCDSDSALSGSFTKCPNTLLSGAACDRAELVEMIAEIPDQIAPLFLAPSRSGAAGVHGEEVRGFVRNALVGAPPDLLHGRDRQPDLSGDFFVRLIEHRTREHA